VNSVLSALYAAIWVKVDLYTRQATLRTSEQYMLLPLSGKWQEFMEWAISKKKG
jgi:hypothetical protein